MVSENISERNLLETITHNRNTESLTAQQIANNYAVGMAQASATRYAAQLNYAGTKYAADSALASAQYSAKMSFASSGLRNATNLLSNARNNSTTIRKTNIEQEGSNARTLYSGKVAAFQSLVGMAGNVSSSMLRAGLGGK